MLLEFSIYTTTVGTLIQTMTENKPQTQSNFHRLLNTLIPIYFVTTKTPSRYRLMLGGVTPPFSRREGIPVAMVMKPGQQSRTRCYNGQAVDRIG